MMKRARGATLSEIMKTTGWQVQRRPHSAKPHVGFEEPAGSATLFLRTIQRPIKPGSLSNGLVPQHSRACASFGRACALALLSHAFFRLASNKMSAA